MTDRPVEIEITQEMIEAGVAAIATLDLADGYGGDLEILIREILTSALQAAIRPAPRDKVYEPAFDKR